MAVRDLSTSDAVFKPVINKTLSDEWKAWKAGAVSIIMVVCLALQAIIKEV